MKLKSITLISTVPSLYIKNTSIHDNLTSSIRNHIHTSRHAGSNGRAITQPQIDYRYDLRAGVVVAVKSLLAAVGGSSINNIQTHKQAMTVFIICTSKKLDVETKVFLMIVQVAG